MPLKRVRITTLRCLTDVGLELAADRNYLYGPNGAGKTSVLESLYLLGRGRSFRTRETRRLVQYGREAFTVFGEAEVEGRLRRVGVAFDGTRLEKRIDGDPAAGTAALADVLPVYVADPSLHELIEGRPSARRRFLDWGVFHVEPGYLDAWRQYRRVLSQRNAVLAASSASAELASWTAAVVTEGERVGAAREAYVNRLKPFLADLGEVLLDEALSIDYRPGWRAGATLAQALDASLARDRASGRTEVGPHRADLAIRVGVRPVRHQASRGQQKLVAAGLILSQVSAFAEARGRGAVLLVDDPAAELDRYALSRFLGVLEQLRAQLVLAALSPEQLPPKPGAPVFHVEQGRVEAMV